MRFSTARWWTIILISIGAVPISTYFYLDEQEKTIPSFLYVITKPLAMVTLFPALLILMASIMATRKNEELITKQNFQSAFIVLIGLIAFRVITHLV